MYFFWSKPWANVAVKVAITLIKVYCIKMFLYVIENCQRNNVIEQCVFIMKPFSIQFTGSQGNLLLNCTYRKTEFFFGFSARNNSIMCPTTSMRKYVSLFPCIFTSNVF